MLDRFEDAKAAARRAFAEQFESPGLHLALLWIALMEGDGAAADEVLRQLAGTPYEVNAIDELVSQAIALGQRRRAIELLQAAAASARAHARSDLATLLTEAAASDLYGDCQVHDAVVGAPRACADPREALKVVESSLGERPGDTILSSVELPRLRAVLELRSNRPDDAVALLAAAVPYERRYVGTVYLRGQAYLRSGRWLEAAAEFQKIVDRRASSWGAWYPLAHVSLARAALRAGDIARARNAYEAFLNLWKEADPDIPILIEARREYSALRSRDRAAKPLGLSHRHERRLGRNPAAHHIRLGRRESEEASFRLVEVRRTPGCAHETAVTMRRRRHQQMADFVSDDVPEDHAEGTVPGLGERGNVMPQRVGDASALCLGGDGDAEDFGGRAVHRWRCGRDDQRDGEVTAPGRFRIVEPQHVDTGGGVDAEHVVPRFREDIRSDPRQILDPDRKSRPLRAPGVNLGRDGEQRPRQRGHDA
jgi:tetratricopeptide (TPR) repeat protein